MMDKVSVIMPLYNHASLVSEAIDSVLAQTYKNIEIIVIDDGSRDNARQVLSRYIEEEKIKYIYQDNQGLASARNRGIKEATGQFIKFLDSDDFIYPEQIEKQLKSIKDEPRAFSTTDYHDLRPSGEMVRRHVHMPRKEKQLASFIQVNQVVVHAFLTPKRLIDEAGGFDESLTACEDWDLWLRILESGACIKHIPEAGCCYRVSPASMSSDMKRMYVQECRVIEKVASHLKLEKSLPDFVKDAVLWICVRLTEEGFGRGFDPRRLLPNTYELGNRLFRERKQGPSMVLYRLLGLKGFARLKYEMRKIKDINYEYQLVNSTNIHRYGEDFKRLDKPLVLRVAERFSSLDHSGIILMYHRVSRLKSDPWELNVTPENFDEHMRVLLKMERAVTFQGLIGNYKRFPRWNKRIVVTFDDGYADNFHHAWPVLQKYRVPATFFIISSAVGSTQEFWWDELERILFTPYVLPPLFIMTIKGVEHYWGISPKPTRIYYQDLPPNGVTISRIQLCFSLWEILSRLSIEERSENLRQIMLWTKHTSQTRSDHLPMSRQQLVLLAQSPNIEIGAHTHRHPLLSTLPRESQMEEVRNSKDELEKIIKSPVKSFAYPHGDYSRATVDVIKNLGFDGACTTHQAPVTRETDPYCLPRFHVQNWDGREFENRMLNWLK